MTGAKQTRQRAEAQSPIWTQLSRIGFALGRGVLGELLFSLLDRWRNRPREMD